MYWIVSPARMLSDITGLVTLAILCGLCFALYPGIEEVRRDWTVYTGVYAVLSVPAWWIWREDLDGTKIPWPNIMLGSIGLGAAFFLCDIFIGRLTHSELSLLDAAFHAGGLVGFAVTLIVCPGGTSIALSGWFRSLLLRRALRSARDANSPEA
jgi:hypothetical protein